MACIDKVSKVVADSLCVYMHVNTDKHMQYTHM